MGTQIKIGIDLSAYIVHNRFVTGNYAPIGESMEECTLCANYTYDMEFSEYYCDINMDEDDFVRFISNNYEQCPYFRNGDEYEVVRKQI